jgi:hypothetical protein
VRVAVHQLQEHRSPGRFADRLGDRGDVGLGGHVVSLTVRSGSKRFCGTLRP